MKHIYAFFFILLNICGFVHAQTGVIKGVITDRGSKETIPAVTVALVGTYKGTIANDDGVYTLKDVNPGEYSLRFFIDGYTDVLINGVKVTAGDTTKLDVLMGSAAAQIADVEIVGQKNLIDVEAGNSSTKLNANDLKDLNVQDVQQIASMQVGVNQTTDGIQIRGSRVYETQYMIDGINAQDPLSGTGFGVDVAKNAIEDIEIVTGGADAEYGNATGGLINTRIKEGGDKLRINGGYSTDNFFTGKNTGPAWYTDNLNLALGGPLIPRFKPDSLRKKGGIQDKLFFFASVDMRLTNDFTRLAATQLRSSILDNTEFWAPRQDNRWSGTFKLTYKIKPAMKLSLSHQQSLTVNQNTRMLMILGSNEVLQPGFQYPFSLNLDNANTYTQQSALTIVNFTTMLSTRWSLNASLGRLFTNLRQDANGRPFRDKVIDRVYDPMSIVTDPITLFNPENQCDTCVVLLNPTTALINNNGIATQWHDHYAQEYTLKAKFNYAPSKRTHYFSMGFEHKFQEYQWVDVTRPWVGAPLVIGNTVISSNRIGLSNDVWKVNPSTGSLFIQDNVRFRGIIASFGLNLTYWSAGKFADDAVADPNAPVLQVIRNQYYEQTFKLLDGLRYKARLLPKIRVSFPITDNNVLYFNYSHDLRLQHPLFIYAGLDPIYQDRSFLSRLGNPNLNPETTVSYEVGLKSQLNKNTALTLTAFYRDKFDFVVPAVVQIRDRTGRFVDKQLQINQDYARIRGLEAAFQQRVGDWLRVMLSGAFQVATGKSNSATEAALAIRSTGRNDAFRETFLAWDRPFEGKAIFVLKSPGTTKSIWYKNWTCMLTLRYQTGWRYTPVIKVRQDTIETTRAEYTPDLNNRLTRFSAPWFWSDIRITRDFQVSKRLTLAFYAECRNLFDNLNASAPGEVNPLTGAPWRPGDPVTFDVRNPAQPHPNDARFGRSDPRNPARYLATRQLLFGFNFNF